MPESRPFCHLLRVRYGECDAQQIVFNSRYLDYVDVAMTEFIRALWGDYQSMLEAGYDNQVVSASIDWRASARFDDILALYVETEKLGNTSYTLRCAIRRHNDDALLAEVLITYVLVDVRSMQKTPLNDELREMLAKGAAGVVVDHAGLGLGKS